MSSEEVEQIENEADYDSALTAIDNLMGAAPNTYESDELDILVTLVEAYEAKHWPMDALVPTGSIRQWL